MVAFGVAGIANATPGTARSVLAATLAIAGVYGIARVARGLSRPILARLSLGLWLAFITIAVVHLPGIETVAVAAPTPDTATIAGLTGLTWATLVGACSTTSFLAIEEATMGAESTAIEDSVVEQEYDF
ncbi:hypothetical protein ACLI4Y_15980 [Natrialbaceae archaeon A-CW3]